MGYDRQQDSRGRAHVKLGFQQNILISLYQRKISNTQRIRMKDFEQQTGEMPTIAKQTDRKKKVHQRHSPAELGTWCHTQFHLHPKCCPKNHTHNTN